MRDFTTIANNVTVMFALLMITILLIYIAFYKDKLPDPRDRHKKELN